MARHSEKDSIFSAAVIPKRIAAALKAEAIENKAIASTKKRYDGKTKNTPLNPLSRGEFKRLSPFGGGLRGRNPLPYYGKKRKEQKPPYYGFLDIVWLTGTESFLNIIREINAV